MKTLKDRQNVGGLDRLGRLAAALALAAAAASGTLTAGWSAVAIAASVALLVTAAAGFCPGYLPFGIDTRATAHGTP